MVGRKTITMKVLCLARFRHKVFEKVEQLKQKCATLTVELLICIRRILLDVVLMKLAYYKLNRQIPRAILTTTTGIGEIFHISGFEIQKVLSNFSNLFNSFFYLFCLIERDFFQELSYTFLSLGSQGPNSQTFLRKFLNIFVTHKTLHLFAFMIQNINFNYFNIQSLPNST